MHEFLRGRSGEPLKTVPRHGSGPRTLRTSMKQRESSDAKVHCNPIQSPSDHWRLQTNPMQSASNLWRLREIPMRISPAPASVVLRLGCGPSSPAILRTTPIHSAAGPASGVADDEKARFAQRILRLSPIRCAPAQRRWPRDGYRWAIRRQ
jgi:hypothetical protein